jgi:hypothetical protein
MNALKNLLIATTIAATALANSQTETLRFVEGQGVAKNQNRGAEFRLRAAKNTQGQLEARFNFASGNPNENGGVKIELKRPLELIFDGNRSLLKGNAVMTARNNGETRRFEGKLEVIAWDIVNPPVSQNPNDPHDRIVVKFHAPANNNHAEVNYTFEGLVMRGDIKIGPRNAAN